MKRTYEQLEQQFQRAQHEISKLKNLLQAFIWQQVELPQVAANVTQFNCQKYYCRSCGNRSVSP